MLLAPERSPTVFGNYLLRFGVRKFLGIDACCNEKLTTPFSVVLLLWMSHILRAIARITEVLSIKAAIQSGDVNVVWLAVESGTTVNDVSFIQACELGHTEIVRFLIGLPVVNPVQ